MFVDPPTTTVTTSTIAATTQPVVTTVAETTQEVTTAEETTQQDITTVAETTQEQTTTPVQCSAITVNTQHIRTQLSTNLQYIQNTGMKFDIGISAFHFCEDPAMFDSGSKVLQYTCQSDGTWKNFDPNNYCRCKTVYYYFSYYILLLVCFHCSVLFVHIFTK